jgi:hypothetical protein
VSGARWVQTEILEKNDDANLRVYAIYFEIVDGDRGAKSTVDPKSLLDDPRVTSFWDDGKLVGRWFDENVTKLGAREGDPGRIEWDTFVLYDARAEWSDERPEASSWGRPLFSERDRLRRDLEGALERAR